MGFKTGSIFGKKAASKVCVELWTAKDVGTWVKSINLPKNCLEALKPVTGKVLLDMTEEDWLALFPTAPPKVHTAVFMNALEELKQDLSQFRLSAQDVCPPKMMERRRSFFGEKPSSGSLRRTGQLAGVFSRQRNEAASSAPDSGRSSPLPYHTEPDQDFLTKGEATLSKGNELTTSIQKGDRSTTDDGFDDGENVSANAPKHDYDEPVHQDVSIPVGFAPSSNISSALHTEDDEGTVPAAGEAVAVTSTAQVEALASDSAFSGPYPDAVVSMPPKGSVDLPKDADVGDTLKAPATFSNPEPERSTSLMGATDIGSMQKTRSFGSDKLADVLDISLKDACADEASNSSVQGACGIAGVSMSPVMGMTLPQGPASVSERSMKSDPSPLALHDCYRRDGGTSGKALHEHALYLTGFTDGVGVDDLANFLYPLDRCKDLVDICRCNSLLGAVFGAVYHAHRDSQHATCIPENAAHFREFCMSVLAALGLAGRRKKRISEDTCKKVVDGFHQAGDLMLLFCKPGWFLHLAFMEDVKGHFDRVHDSISHALQQAQASDLPGGRVLHNGDYKDPTRTLRRVLKQIGQGSVAEGASIVATNATYQANVAAVLGMPLPVLVEDLGTLPLPQKGGARVDLAKMYASLNAVSKPFNSTSADLDAHDALFSWYDEGGKGFLDFGDLKRVLHDLGLLESIANKDQFVASQFALADKTRSAALSPAEFSAYYSSLVFAEERNQLRTRLGIEAEEELKHQFLAFANFGVHTETVSDMDGAHFAKYCNDCRLLKGGVTVTDVDLAFAKVKAKASRRITFDQFLRALNILAGKRGSTLPVLVASAIKHLAPANHASTRVHSIRLHDDKSTYTGVYARGGPDNFDGYKDLSQITNRKPADQRGVNLPQRATTPRHSKSDGASRSGRLGNSPMAGHSGYFSMPNDTMSLTGSVTPPMGMRRVSHRSAATPTSARLHKWEKLGDLQKVFISFALFGKGQLSPDVQPNDIMMDSKGFAKLLKEANLVDSNLDLTRVDLCFTRAANKAKKRLNFSEFQAALEACAAVKGTELSAFMAAVAACHPRLHGTVAEPVKWHDDRSTYTGVYARGGPTCTDKKVDLKELVDRQAQEPSKRRMSQTPTWAH